MTIEVCPRCGRVIAGYSIEERGGRKYVYAVHYVRDKRGRKKTRKCYLGPLTYYEYVSRLHTREGLLFKGLHDRHRLIEYLEAIAYSLKHVKPRTADPRVLMRIAKTLKTIANELERIAREVKHK